MDGTRDLCVSWSDLKVRIGVGWHMLCLSVLYHHFDTKSLLCVHSLAAPLSSGSIEGPFEVSPTKNSVLDILSRHPQRPGRAEGRGRRRYAVGVGLSAAYRTPVHIFLVSRHGCAAIWQHRLIETTSPSPSPLLVKATAEVRLAKYGETYPPPRSRKTIPAKCPHSKAQRLEEDICDSRLRVEVSMPFLFVDRSLRQCQSMRQAF